MPTDHQQQQPIGVQTDHKADGTSQAGQGETNGDKGGTQILPPLQAGGSIGAPKGCDDECQRRAEERSEYWIIGGHRIKITDFLLALFTFLLVVVGGFQSFWLRQTVKDTGKSAEAALITAKATELNVRAFVANALPDISFTGVYIAREDTTGAHAPGMQQVPIQRIPHVLEDDTVIAFGVKNIGQGTAVVTHYAMQYVIGAELPAQPDNLVGASLSFSLVGGQDQMFMAADGPRLRFTPEQHAAIQARTQHLWIYGVLTFRDTLKQITDTGFLVKWNPNANGEGRGDFQWQGGEAYSYARKREPENTPPAHG
jgi:hypothetical protein